MGAQFTKTAGKEETAAENPGEAAVSPSKANGQVPNTENGHLKVNGDASPAAAEQKEEVRTNGTAPAEDGEKNEEAPAEKEATDGNTEAIAPTEEEAAMDGATPSTSNETPKKKKKRFSFKKSFKLSGFSFKKTKKETGDNGEEAVAAGDDEAKTDGAVEGVSEEKAQTTEEAAKPEQNPVEETKPTSPTTEESKTEPAVATEPSPSQNEAAAAEESAPSAQEAECSPEAQAEAATEQLKEWEIKEVFPVVQWSGARV